MWHLELETPAGPREGTVRLTCVGREVRGSWNDGAQNYLFDDGRVEGPKVRWTVKTPSAAGPIDILFEGMIEGNSMSGRVEVGAEGGAGGVFHGERMRPSS
jgi:hypothetical protein